MFFLYEVVDVTQLTNPMRLEFPSFSAQRRGKQESPERRPVTFRTGAVNDTGTLGESEMGEANDVKQIPV